MKLLQELEVTACNRGRRITFSGLTGNSVIWKDNSVAIAAMNFNFDYLNHQTASVV
jgi:hypothetical protein